MNNKEIEFCLTCGSENDPDNPICECGGRKFVYGRGVTFKEGIIYCACGVNNFKRKMHINKAPIYETKYVCLKCSNIVGVQWYDEGNG